MSSLSSTPLPHWPSTVASWRTADTEITLDLRLQDSYTGCRQVLGVKRKVICPQCHGGKQEEKDTKRSICETCLDKWIVDKMDSVEILVEPGTQEGDTVIVPFFANEFPGFITGNLRVAFKLIPDPRLQLTCPKTGELSLLLHITMTEALSGTVLRFQHLDGKVRVLEMPPLSWGASLKIAGWGMPLKNNTYGNLLIQFTVQPMSPARLQQLLKIE